MDQLEWVYAFVLTLCRELADWNADRNTDETANTAAGAKKLSNKSLYCPVFITCTTPIHFF